LSCSKEVTMARKSPRRRTPEEKAAWRERHERFMRLLEQRLEHDGMTKEEVMCRLREAQ